MPFTPAQLAALLHPDADMMLVISRQPIGTAPRCTCCGRKLIEAGILDNSLFVVACANRQCKQFSVRVTIACVVGD